MDENGSVRGQVLHIMAWQDLHIERRSRATRGHLVRASMAALVVLGLPGCSNPGTEAVEALRDDPLADAHFGGVSQVGETVTSEGSERRCR